MASSLIASGPNANQRVKTTYGYSSVTGELLSQTYNDSTPAVTYAYGRTGQVESVQDYTCSGSSDLRDLVYDSAKPWRLAAELR